MKRWHKWGLAGLALFMIVFFPEVILPLVYYLLTGWVGFLGRVLPQMRWDPLGLMVGLGAFCGLIVGAHLLIRSFLAPTPEPDLPGDDGPLVTDASATGMTNAAPGEKGPDQLPAVKWAAKHTLLLVCLIVLFCAISIAATSSAHAALWFVGSDPPAWAIRYKFFEYAHSRDRLRQLGRALIEYDEKNGTLPPGGTFRPDGTQGHSWMTSLLPYLKRGELFQRIRPEEPWNSPHNAPQARTAVEEFTFPAFRPTFGPEGYALASFAANQYVMGANQNIAISKIYDGTSQTIVAGEVKEQRRPWADPRNFRDPGLKINESPQGFGGSVTDGAMFLMADGTVRFINQKIDPQVLHALATPQGNERVGDF